MSAHNQSVSIQEMPKAKSVNKTTLEVLAFCQSNNISINELDNMKKVTELATANVSNNLLRELCTSVVKSLDWDYINFILMDS